MYKNPFNYNDILKEWSKKYNVHYLNMDYKKRDTSKAMGILYERLE